ncbi:GlxA family transcriptional regulator [Amaricoccus solimangrovi]|uniref:GlxA family transcriptional regulator n=1 Tax=Amaricoccus solimangrovi TaxID=2589815 RepID=A0A501WRS8_9RHOB|nr:GlxA family transcriptional regulator [Amaricoccus solimangrovi]TPE50794.1 GlxA family transcriptional regulator [Amaricoccus solimangrovi]
MADSRPEPFVFLLVPRFTMIAFASAVEPLRLANKMAGRPLYQWRTLSEEGGLAAASNGIRIQTDGGLGELTRDTTLIVIGGSDVKESVTRPILTWLRRESRRVAAIGAVCTGAQVLAEAGLLDGRRCTIHWENRVGFDEDFPEIDVTPNVYVIDQNRYTAAGGVASTDLMLKLIARKHGTELANLVADQMIHTEIRSDRDEQRLSIPTRIGIRHPKLSTVMHRMETHIEEPISPADLAEEVGMSTRQLERLFRRYLNRSPKRYYMELRLKKARNLLMQTEMSVINVALACGFASPSHFSKCYRAFYQTTPYRERGTLEILE